MLVLLGLSFQLHENGLLVKFQPLTVLVVDLLTAFLLGVDLMVNSES